MDESAQERSHDILDTLELVTNAMAVAVTRCRADFRYLWANQAYADWLQRSLSEIVGRPILEVMGKDAFEALRLDRATDVGKHPIPTPQNTYTSFPRS